MLLGLESCCYCLKIALRYTEGSEYFRAKKGCFFTQAVTAQRGCEEATGQLACHVSAASDLSSLQFGSKGRVMLEGHGVLHGVDTAGIPHTDRLRTIAKKGKLEREIQRHRWKRNKGILWK